MTGNTADVDTEWDRGDHRRFARIETAHDDPTAVAAAVAPDNTADVDTEAVESDGVVRTRIRRETTGGLQSTVDDYVVNLIVAERLSGIAADHADALGYDGNSTDRRTRHETDDTHHE
ncbi:Subunit of KEOPS complex [Halalkaliarchaeum sp. AArc-CO]|uniref:KEOPS complex subunit Pcc1 n=1 Tax=unclassified Halalkaliarchaeum TaxID=2678344 RepID=UPI00217EFDAA|nr:MULTISPECIES: KEOPS complex subunit Pcc1 [unclassified Halalkaliarchaeum]MDR5674299.1 KEOPS complex subunit Pcc1 [Halalkaliarchaeum sp. AArc-GB]UWG50722.1 Subunit of KEOPS complex [Halalkaliarchaeum sp. AArc-CO]